MPAFLDPARLRALVVRYRRSATPTVRQELGESLLRIAAAVWDRYHFVHDRDDFIQEVSLHLLGRPTAKADVQKNVFAYYYTCAFNFGTKLRERAIADLRRFDTYAQELLESGRELPCIERPGRDRSSTHPRMTHGTGGD